MNFTDIFKILIILFLYSLVFFIAEFLHSKNFSTNITRKIVHIGGGIVSALLPYFVNLNLIILLGSCFFMLLLISKRKNFLKSVHKIDEESVGAILFPIALTLTAIFFWEKNPLIFQGSALILGISDGFACIGGKKYGKRKFRITGDKTFEGSFIFFISTVILLFFTLYLGGVSSLFSIFFAIVGSIVLTLTEAIFSKGWDNLFVPIVAGLIISFIL